MDVSTLPLDKLDVISAKTYGENGYPHEAWTRLRQRSAGPLVRPRRLQAVLGDHQARRHHRDLEAAREVPQRRPLHPLSRRARALGGADARGERRRSACWSTWTRPSTATTDSWCRHWFTPRAIARLEARLEEITREIFDDLDEGRRRARVRLRHATSPRMQPLRMITEMLGIPREREQFVLRVTNENFGSRIPSSSAAAPPEDAARLPQEAFGLLRTRSSRTARATRATTSRACSPTPRSTAQPVPPFELFSLYFLLMVAGHDTTRNAISGGLLALLEHPRAVEKLAATTRRWSRPRSRRSCAGRRR